MNKQRLLVVLCAALSVASCTKQTVQADPDAWTSDTCVPVPVKIGAGAGELAAKALPVNTLDGCTFGVAGLGSQDGDYPILLCMPARCDATGGVELLDSEGESVQVYYPIRTENNYSFYAYYVGDGLPYVKLDKFGDRFGVNIPEYGKVDVLCGASHAQPVYTSEGVKNGFNAEYIRTLYRMGLYDREHLPSVRMSHLCSQLCFHFCFDSVESSGWDHIYLTRLAAKGAGTSAYLTIEDGKINYSGVGTVDNNMFLPFGSEAVMSGDTIFYFPPDVLDTLVLEMYFTYALNVGHTKVVIDNEQLREVLAHNGVDRLKEGCCYRFDAHVAWGAGEYSVVLKAHK